MTPFISSRVRKLDVGIPGYTDTSNVVDVTGKVSIGTKIDIAPYDNINNGTLRLEGSAGTLFSISNNLTTGSIFSVNDVTGVPSLDVNADGTILLAPFGQTEYIGIGKTNPTQKVDIDGSIKLSGNLLFENINVISYSAADVGVDTISFEGSEGQLFSVTNNLSTGSLFSVNNVAGLPYINVDADGTIIAGINAAVGNFGIGTETPTEKLEVVGSIKASDGLILSDTGPYNTVIQYVTPTNNRNISFPDATGTIALVAGTTGQIQYNDNGKLAASPNFVIDSNGNVGIGTSSPSQQLDIAGPNGWSTEIGEFFLNFTRNDESYIHAGSEPGATTGRLVFYLNGSEAARFNEFGDFGIGTNNPTVKFEVFDGDILLNSTDRKIFLSNDSDQYITANATSNYLVLGTANQERLRINSTGNVGIGTVSPSSSLHVAAEANHSIILERSGAVAPGNVTLNVSSFGDSSLSSTRGLGLQSGPAGSLVFSTSGANERARITSDGILLVGTTSARTRYANKVQIETIGGQSSYGLTTIYNANDVFGAAIAIGKSRGTSVESVTVVQSGDILGELQFIGTDGFDQESAASIKAEVDGTATTTAGSFVIGRRYKIATVGTTNFTLIGASANTVGVIFAATGVGTGTGTATSEPYNNSMPGRLVFATTADGSAIPTERMRIDSSGNVGIGTDAPEHTLDIRGDLKTEYLIATTAFSDNLTNVSVARLTGVLNPILTLPSTSGKKYVIHSIYASNIARVEQQTAGASATIATTGFDTEKNIGAADALRTEGVYTIPSDVWTTDGSGTEAVFIITVDGTGAATIAVDYAGIGFAVDDTITVPDANLGAGGAADLTFQVATLTGVVESVNLLVPGEGYVEPPTVYFDDGTTGTGSIITADVDSDGKLIRLNLINRGSGYVEDDGNLLRIDAPPLTATEIGISGSFVDSSTSVESYFAFDVPIPVGGALDILKQPQILNPNDIIKMQSYDADGSGLSDAADVFIAYEEVDDTFYTGSVASLTTTANTTLLTAPSTNPLLVRSIRLTNTEFVGDYDVSIKVNNGSNTYYLVRNIIIPAFATVEICDTPRRIEANWSIEAELSVIGQDVNLASSIDIQVSAKKL